MEAGWSPSFAAANIYEPGKFKLLLFLIPLYTRINRDEVENSEARGEILGYLRQNPGAHYSILRKDLKFGNNKLAYHLDVLEKSGRIKWRNDGRLKRYYPRSYSIPKEQGIKMQLMRLLKGSPGLNQKQIAVSLGIDPRTAANHLGDLQKEGKITIERSGRETKYARISVVEGGEERLL